MVEAGEHYRPEDGRSVYRVVGTDGEITLLRVTDDDERRVHTGELRRVSRDELETGFASAENPDASISPVAAIRNLLQGMYWEVRKFL